MTCIACNSISERDYPVCVACETRRHFTNRDDCRCVGCRPGPRVIVLNLAPSPEQLAARDWLVERWVLKVLIEEPTSLQATDSAPAASADHGVDSAVAA